MTTSIRPARDADAAVIASIWESGWREAHLGRVPEALVRARTTQTFRSRSLDHVPQTLVATANGAVIGFVVTIADELEQIYVKATSRGGGVASSLLEAAEARIAAAGFSSAWLAVVAENARARRFYERCGWIDDGGFQYAASTQDGPVDVPCRRYTKELATE